MVQRGVVLAEFQDTYNVYYNRACISPTESNKRECQRFVNLSRSISSLNIEYQKNIDAVHRYINLKGVSSKLIKKNLLELKQKKLVSNPLQQQICPNALRHKCFITVMLCLVWDTYSNYFNTSPVSKLSISVPKALPVINIHSTTQSGDLFNTLSGSEDHPEFYEIFDVDFDLDY